MTRYALQCQRLRFLPSVAWPSPRWAPPSQWQNDSPPHSQASLKKVWAAGSLEYSDSVHPGNCSHYLLMYFIGHNLISELQLATRETRKWSLCSGWLWDQLKIRNSDSTKEGKNIYQKKLSSLCCSHICVNSKSLVLEKL